MRKETDSERIHRENEEKNDAHVTRMVLKWMGDYDKSKAAWNWLFPGDWK